MINHGAMYFMMRYNSLIRRRLATETKVLNAARNAGAHVA